MFAANIGVSDRPWSFNRNCLWNVPWSMDEKPRFSHSISSPTSNFVQAERKRSMQHMRRYRLKTPRSWGSVRRKYEDSLMPSGKLSKNYRTSPFWIGKSTIKGIFSIANCNKFTGYPDKGNLPVPTGMHPRFFAFNGLITPQWPHRGKEHQGLAVRHPNWTWEKPTWTCDWDQNSDGSIFSHMTKFQWTYQSMPAHMKHSIRPASFGGQQPDSRASWAWHHWVVAWDGHPRRFHGDFMAKVFSVQYKTTPKTITTLWPFYIDRTSTTNPVPSNFLPRNSRLRNAGRLARLAMVNVPVPMETRETTPRVNS